MPYSKFQYPPIMLGKITKTKGIRISDVKEILKRKPNQIQPILLKMALLKTFPILTFITFIDYGFTKRSKYKSFFFFFSWAF